MSSTIPSHVAGGRPRRARWRLMDADERFDALADEAISLLRAKGPMRAVEVFSSLLTAHDHDDDPGLADDLEDVVENLTEYGVWWLSDDCLALSDHVVGGNRFTHRLTADERERGVLPVGVDLEAVHLLNGDEWTTADGGTVSLESEPGQPEVLTGPPGWLDRFTAGEALACSWSGSTMTLELVDALADGGAVVDLVREVFESNVGRFGVLDLHSLIGLVAVREEHPFAEPAPPVSELLTRAGLVIEGDLVAEQGFDYDAYGAGRKEEHLTHLEDAHGLNRTGAEALERLTSVVWRLDPESGVEVDDEFDAAAAALRNPEVAMAWIEDHLENVAVRASRDGARVLVSRVLAGPEPPAGAYAVAARLAEHDGNVVGMADFVEQALALDPDFDSALWDAAFVAELRGDARAAIDLRRRGGASREDEPIATMRRFTEPPPGISRNAPCPCGSGRKTKLCCLATLRHPLEHRIHWLHDKLVAVLDRPPFVDTIHDVIDSFTLERDEVPRVLAIAQTSFWSFALFDGGLVGDVLECYGALLPDDERQVAEQWRQVRHRLVRLDDILPGTGLRVTDTISGEQFQVTGSITRGSWRVGEEAVALIVPAGSDRWQMPGEPVVVPASWRDEMVEAFGELEHEPHAVARTCIRWLVAAQVFKWEEARRERVKFVFPGCDPDELDLEDEDLLRELVAEDHVLDDAEDDEDVTLEIHETLHLITAVRIINDEPAGTWQRVQELRRKGFERHEILHDIGYEVTSEIFTPAARPR